MTILDIRPSEDIALLPAGRTLGIAHKFACHQSTSSIFRMIRSDHCASADNNGLGSHARLGIEKHQVTRHDSESGQNRSIYSNNPFTMLSHSVSSGSRQTGLLARRYQYAALL
jgi:hypothetical protein